MFERQVRSIVIRPDGSQTETLWFRNGDPAAIDALREILTVERLTGYLVWWESREARGNTA